MHKFFRFFLILFRLVFGITFIVSGVLKLIDPVGTGLVVSEYFSAFGTAFLKPLSVTFGILLSVLELVTGLAVLVRLRIRFFSWVALCLTVFFTIITFILYKFSPIQDCGCFGEAVHLTNGQTFTKNLLLLVCIIPVFLYRKKYELVARPVAEWIFLAYHFTVALLLSISLYHTGPLAEFGDFKVGTDIQSRLNIGWSGESEDVFVYEKDGVKQSFTISDIPDSTWQFVEMVPGIPEDESDHSFDFAVADAAGQYVTDSILNHTGPVVLFSVYEPGDLDEDEWNEMVEITGHLNEKGIFSRILVSCSAGDSLPEYYASSDYKTLISLSRSNGGMVILDSGTVIKKGYCGEFTESELMDLLEGDFDEMISTYSISENFMLELLLALLILNILFFRYFCGLKRDRRHSVAI